MSTAEAVNVFEPEAQVTFRFSDGVEHKVSISSDETILDAARRSDVPMTWQCLTGSCSSCLCKVGDGEVSMDSSRMVSLLPSEIKEGLRLACAAYATSDSTIELDYPSTFSEDHEVHQDTAVVTDLEWVNHNTVRLEMELPEDTEFDDFEAGQYVQLKVPGTEEWRSYSMASTARDLPEMTFFIRVLDEGVMSDYLRNRCSIGDEIPVDGAYGVFYLREEKVPQIMVAGGTGLAPMLSMIDTLRLNNFRRKSVILAFGCSHERDLFSLDDLEMRSDWMRNLDVRTCVSRPEGDWDGHTCRAQFSITADDIVDEDAIAYLCGPPAMIEDAKEHLVSLGVKAENIHVELFESL